MFDSYLKTAFFMNVSATEANLLSECLEIADQLEAGFPEETDLNAYNEQTSQAFKDAFPMESEADPFGTFLKLFDDPDYPNFGVKIQVSDHYDPERDGRVAFVSGEQADVEALAKLIQKACSSSLPFGFEWAATSSSLVADAQGGGYFVVTKDEITGGSTQDLMRKEMSLEIASRPAPESDATPTMR